MSGTIAACLNIPFDVAKSRIQGSHDSTQYKGTLNTMHIVYKKEGYLHYNLFVYAVKDPDHLSIISITLDSEPCTRVYCRKC